MRFPDTLGAENFSFIEVFKQLVGQSPMTMVKMGSVEINCVIDTGSMVSMVTVFL